MVQAKQVRKDYERSEQGEQVRKDYERSEKGEQVRKDYESSELRKLVKKNYEEMAQAKQARTDYERSEQGQEVRKDYERSEQVVRVRKDYEKSEEGLKVRKNYEQKRLLGSYESDTGFNNICCSCNEYKSRQACVNIIKRGSNESRFTQEEESQFLLREKDYNLSLDGNFYVCVSCNNQNSYY